MGGKGTSSTLSPDGGVERPTPDLGRWCRSRRCAAPKAEGEERRGQWLGKSAAADRVARSAVSVSTALSRRGRGSRPWRQKEAQLHRLYKKREFPRPNDFKNP